MIHLELRDGAVGTPQLNLLALVGLVGERGVQMLVHVAHGLIELARKLKLNRARLLVVVERRGIVAETIVDLGPEDRLAKTEYALDGAQPVILAASVSYVDDASFVLPSGVATEPSDALPPHEAHPLPAHRTPFPKPLM